MSLAAPTPDPATPRFRVRPPAHWINDPNGPFHWRGRHHLFYQHNPAAPVHTNIHWGHASSPDLVRWEHHPIALAPTPGGPDEAGCWSGCVVDDGGVPTAVYTGVDHTHTGLGTICLARAADPGDERLLGWRPLSDPVVSAPPPGLDVVMFRDPFVFPHSGRRWALVGAGLADGTPSVLLYDCEELTDWRFAGVLLDGTDPVAADAFGDKATGWECPQLYGTSGGEHVLVVSLWDGEPCTSAYLTGRLELSGKGGLSLTTRTGGRLDHGRDFYAPAVRQDSGRTLLWGWSWEARDKAAVLAAGWAGTLTAPRVVDVHPDGSLRVFPAPELELLRAAEPFASAPGLAPLPASYDLSVTARGTTTVTLLRAADRALTVRLDPAAGTVVLDRSGWPRAGAGGSAPITVSVPPGAGERDDRRERRARADRVPSLTVRILVDGSLLELFAGERAMVTERVYRRTDDVAELVVVGDAEVSAWEQVPPSRG